MLTKTLSNKYPVNAQPDCQGDTRNMKLKLIATSLLSILLLNVLVFAHTYKGSIRGTVSDQQGARIAKAQVQLTNMETNEIRTVTSSEEGEFVISLLPPGRYRVETQSTGFMKYTQ